MRLLYLIGGVVAFFVIAEVYARIRGRIGYATDLSKVEDWIRKHVRGGSHNSRLFLRDTSGEHCVEFHKWAPRIGFGGRLEPSTFFLIIREGQHCSAEEFTCAQDLLESKAASCDVEAGREPSCHILRADIGPNTKLATDLARDLYRDCFGLDDPALKACYGGQVRMRPSPVIAGWTDKLSQKKAAHYERKKYEGKTELHPWAKSCSPPMARFMIKNRDGAIDMRNQHGATPLITAAYFGNYDAAEVLLQEGAKIRACDRTRRTALHCAAWKGHVEIAKLLLEHGALTGIEDKEGKTPLDLARENGHEEIVRLLSGDKSEGDENTSDSPQEEKGQLKS